MVRVVGTVPLTAPVKLTPVDMVSPNWVSPRFMSRVLFWYATDDASDATRDAHFARLQAGLGQLLDLCPILGGRLDYDHECVVPAPSGGIDAFLQQDLSVSVRDVASRGFPPEDQHAGYTVDTHLHTDGASLLAVHLTQLRDGFVVGCGAHHILLDGGGQFNLMVTLGQLIRGAPVSLHPVCDRSALMPREGEVPTQPHPEVMVVPPSDEEIYHSATAPGITLPCTGRFIRVRRTVVEAAKALALGRAPACEAPSLTSSEEPASRLSANDVICALLWRAFVRVATGPEAAPAPAPAPVSLDAGFVRDDRPSSLGYVVDVRPRAADPSVDPGYIGNATVWAMASAPSVSALLGQPFGATAAAVRATTNRVTPSTIRSFLAFLGAVKDKARARPSFLPLPGNLNPGPDFCLTSWVRFPLMQVDLGFGLPTAVRPLAFGHGFAIITPPVRAHAETDCMSLFLGLYTHLWPVFERDPEVVALGLLDP